MGMFISLRVDGGLCADAQACARCVKVCPVDVFVLENGVLTTDEDNEDECTLCELCLRNCPNDAIRLVKLYEEPG